MAHTGESGVAVVLGGKAKVFCVHDWEKRQVTTEEHAAYLLLKYGGIEYNPKLHKLHTCSCCENLFWAPHSEPVYCDKCSTGVLIHPLGGPLSEPKGVVG